MQSNRHANTGHDRYKRQAQKNRSEAAMARHYREIKVADRTGLEPATSGVTGRHSNQLNYRSAPVKTRDFLVGDDGFEPPTLAL